MKILCCRCYDSITFSYDETGNVSFGDLILCGNENFENGSNIFPGEFQAVFRTGEPEDRDIPGCRSTLTPRNYTGFRLNSLCFIHEPGMMKVGNVLWPDHYSRLLLGYT